MSDATDERDVTDTQKDVTERNDKGVGAGESGGGAYPNPHSGTSADTPDGGKAYDETWSGSAGVGHHGGGQAGTTEYTDDARDGGDGKGEG